MPKERRTFHAVMVIFSMILFGYFTGNKLTAFSALLAAGLFMYLAAIEDGYPLQLLGLSLRGKNPGFWMAAGVVSAAMLALYYRFQYSEALLPGGLGLIAIAAPLIGMTEELVYRGFIQGILSHRHPATAILAASAGHTAYKAVLLHTSPAGGMINLTNLVVLTFLIGCLFGYFRFRSGQLYAPLLAHGLFDLIVYGDQALFPSWVWH